MSGFKEYLDKIEESEKKERLTFIFDSIKKEFPQLKEEIKWNQPMFTDHGTFIIGFSVAKGHIAVAPEDDVMALFEKRIEEAGYSHTKRLLRIKWTDEIDFDLIYSMIAFKIEDKKDYKKFWKELS